MFLDIIYPLLWFLLIFFGLRYQKIFQLDGLSKWDLSIGFLVKSLVSLLFIYIFSNYYGPGIMAFDSYQYNIDGKILNDVFYKSPIDYLKLLTGIGEDKYMVNHYLEKTGKWYYSYTFFLDDAKNVIRLSSLIHFVSFNSFIIQFLIFDLLSLIGIFYCYRAIKKFSKIHPSILFYGILVLPSLLFWSSALLKEPILLLGIGLFLYTTINFDLKNFKILIMFLISIILLVAFKPYVFISIILIGIILFFHEYLKINRWLSLLIFCVIGIISLYSSRKLSDLIVKPISFKQHDFINAGTGGLFCMDTLTRVEYNINERDYNKIKLEGKNVFIKQKVEINEINRFNRDVLPLVVDSNSNLNLKFLTRLVKSTSYIEVTPIKVSLNQLLLNIPEALVNSMFRPWLTDPGKEFKYFASIETILLFGFLVFAIINKKRLSKSEKTLVFSLLLFALSISLIIGWTTPILGAIVRYRAPVYLAILLISFIIIEPPKRWKKENIS
jgi:hypothetical protein